LQARSSFSSKVESQVLKINLLVFWWRDWCKAVVAQNRKNEPEDKASGRRLFQVIIDGRLLNFHLRGYDG